jgi:hypothetical protein
MSNEMWGVICSCVERGEERGPSLFQENCHSGLAVVKKVMKTSFNNIAMVPPGF